MSWITWVLFESALAWGIVWGLVCFVLLVYWRRGGPRWPFLAALGVLALGFLLQMAVTTPREHAIDILTRIEADILAREVDDLGDVLAPGFEIPLGGRTLDKDAFLVFARERMEVIRVAWLRRTLTRMIARDGARFTVEVFYNGHAQTDDYGSVPFTSGWHVTFERIGEDWRIVEIDPRSPFRRWQDIANVR